MRQACIILAVSSFFTFLQTTVLSMMISVTKAGVPNANGIYLAQSPTVIPEGFAKVCRKSFWNTEQMWKQLTDGKRPWYLKSDDAYIYYNIDGRWWLDAPEGHGLYVAPCDLKDKNIPPSTGWEELQNEYLPLPSVEFKESEGQLKE